MRSRVAGSATFTMTADRYSAETGSVPGRLAGVTTGSRLLTVARLSVSSSRTLVSTSRTPAAQWPSTGNAVRLAQSTTVVSGPNPDGSGGAPIGAASDVDGGIA